MSAPADQRSGSAASGRKSDRVIALLLLLIAASYALLWARNQFLTGDPGYYLGLARSLAAGDGYTFMGEAHTKYPPGLTLLLLPFIHFWNVDPARAQVVVGAFAALSLGSLLYLTSNYNRALTIPLGMMIVFSSAFFSLATIRILSELPYLAATAAALGLLIALGNGRVGPRVAIVSIALLVVVTSAIRTIGIALPCALTATWLQRRLRPCAKNLALDTALAVGALSGFAFFAGWFLWTSGHRTESYFDLMVLADPHEPDRGAATSLELLLRIPNGIFRELTHYGELFFNIPWLKALWFSPLTFLLGGSVAVGVRRELSGANPVLAWYLLGYGGILALWPFNEGARFLLPLFPILLLMSWKGFDSIWQAVEEDPRRLRTVGAATVAVGVLLFGLAIAETLLTGEGSRQNWAAAAANLLIGAAGLAIVLLRPSLAILKVGMRAALWCFLALYCAVGSARIASTAYGNVTGVSRSPTPGLEAGIDWLSRNANADDVVMSEWTVSVYFYTGLESRWLPQTGDRDTLLTSLDETAATYLLIIYPSEFPYYLPTETDRLALILEERKDSLKLVHRFDAGEIYHVEQQPQ